MKKTYISANCEITMIGAQDVIATSSLSTSDSNGGMTLDWTSDGTTLD